MLKKIISLTTSVFITLSLAGCMTTTTTSDVYYDDVSTYVVSGDKQQGNNSGTTSGSGNSQKPNGGDNKTSSADISASHTTTGKGNSTIDFTPIADKGANYNVKGTVRIAVDTARPTDFDAMFDVMQKLYPNVNIKFDYWTHNKTDTAAEYLSARAATGKMADIIWDDAGCIPSYAMQGWIYPITKFVNADPEAGNIPANLKADYTYCGELYALPHQAHFDVNVFNVDLLNKLNLKAPDLKWSFEDYEKYLNTAAEKGFSQKLCVGMGNLGNEHIVYAWWLSNSSKNNTSGDKYGQWGYNYRTNQIDAKYLIEGAKKVRELRAKTGLEAFWEQQQKASNGKSNLENTLGITDSTAAWSTGKALMLTTNTANTNNTKTKYKFKTKVVPLPNENGCMSMHVDCCYITSACSDANIEAAYQLLRFMTFSSNGNLARLTMYEDSQKGKYALNSRIYYPTTTNKAVLDKFNKLSVATDVDKYMVNNIPNSSRLDVHKLVPELYDTFFKDVAPSFNKVINGQDDGSIMNETIANWNKSIKASIDNMNAKIKAELANFKKTHK